MKCCLLKSLVFKVGCENFRFSNLKEEILKSYIDKLLEYVIRNDFFKMRVFLRKKGIG